MTQANRGRGRGQGQNIGTIVRRERRTIAAVLTATARRAGIAIERGSFGYMSDGETILVNAPLTGTENVGHTDLKRGVDLMLLYLQLPPGQTKMVSGSPVATVSTSCTPR